MRHLSTSATSGISLTIFSVGRPIQRRRALAPITIEVSVGIPFRRKRKSPAEKARMIRKVMGLWFLPLDIRLWLVRSLVERPTSLVRPRLSIYRG